MADNRLRSRPDDQRLGKLFTSADSDNCKLGRKSFHVMLFFVDEAAGDQQRERHVLMTGGLEAAVKRLLDVLPKRPPVRAHDHATAHRRVIGKLRLDDQLVVPLGKIFCAGGKFFFGHSAVCPFLSIATTRAK